jgi:hypothetical protein
MRGKKPEGGYDLFALFAMTDASIRASPSVLLPEVVMRPTNSHLPKALAIDTP